MDVVIVLVFISAVLVTAALVLFVMRVHGGDLEHGDRLSLLPLEPDVSRLPAAKGDATRPGSQPGAAGTGKNVRT